MIKYFCDSCKTELKTENEFNIITIKRTQGRGTCCKQLCDNCRNKLETMLNTNFEFTYIPQDPLKEEFL